MREVEMMGTHHRLTIAQRKDRALLLSLYEPGKQVCMVRMNIFAPIANESEFLEKDHPALLCAYKLLKPIADEYAKGEIGRDKLYTMRDEALREMKINPKETASAWRRMMLKEYWWRTEQMLNTPGADGCDLSVDDGRDVTLLMQRAEELLG